MNYETLFIDHVDSIAIIKFDRGVTNPIDGLLVKELASALQVLAIESSVRGVVLTSVNTKFFSIGLNVPELFDLNRKRFHTFYSSFNRLCLDFLAFPKPVVAAMTGHATAGGCILALCCDYRFIADGHTLTGLNEIKLGVPVPFVADCVLRALVGYKNAREIMDSGLFYDPQDALNLGLVDIVLPQERVLPQSIDKASELGSVPGAAFDLIKGNRTEPIKKEALAQLEEKEAQFVECWYSDETRERLQELMKKFSRQN